MTTPSPWHTPQTVELDQYARDCHQLITVEKGVQLDCQSDLERMCTRVVELLTRVESLDNKLEQCSQAWYFPSEDMTQRAIARLVCMCGEQMAFVEPSTRREHRAINCTCGRRWLWRWTDPS